jgi:hypothetical protein
LASRPVFVPNLTGKRMVIDVPVSFHWNAGMSASQKKKNVVALHAAAVQERDLHAILEISSKSERRAGQRLSAFHLPLESEGRTAPLECWFQGSKAFADGGPYTELYEAAPKDAKRDPRLRNSGDLKAFVFEGRSFPLDPPTAFYDWLYLRALAPYEEWGAKLSRFDGFSDIEFNPAKSVNCQARSCALFVALHSRGLVQECARDFDYFVSVQNNDI